MKTLIISLVLLSNLSFLFSQDANENTPLTQTEYLTKSKHQKQAAWALMGGGAVLTTIGFSIAFKDATEELAITFSNTLFPASTPAPEQKVSPIGNVLLLTGFASMAGSIPLFLAAKKNKKKAAQITACLKLENSSMIRLAKISKVQYPSIALRLNF